MALLLNVYSECSLTFERLLPSGSLLADEMNIRADAQEIDQNRNHVPYDDRPRSNQQAVVDPQDLKSTGDCCHRWLHARARPTLEHCN